MSLQHRRRLYGMQLYYHPRSPYCQKVLIALREKHTSVELVQTTPGDEKLAKLTPLGKLPLLVLDDGWKIPESTIIIEYLDTHVATGTRLIPDERDLARQTRFHDRLADLYVLDQVVALLFQRGDQAAAHARLDTLFTGFDAHLAKRTWIMGDAFTMADCALIPGLRLATQLHPFDKWKHLTAYFARVSERPSVREVYDELAPHLAKPA